MKDDANDMRNEIFCLKTENDRLKDDLNGYKALIDTLNMIAPDKVSEAIDIQEESGAGD